MVFPDFPRAEVYPPAKADTPFTVLTEDRQNQALLLDLAGQHGPRLLVREAWSKILPRCGILISSALSGGSFAQRVTEAADTYPRRCWLLIEPIAMEFPLPCLTGFGNDITITNYGKQFFSESLCCQYTHFIRNQQGFMVLWDTEETLRRKTALAKAAGFLGYVRAP